MIQVIDLREVTSSAQVAEWMVDLAEDLRASDLAEIQATSGGNPAEVLVASVMLSDRAYVLLHDGEPTIVFGRSPYAHHGEALVWLMATDGIEHPEVRSYVLRRFLPHLTALHEGGIRRLWNYIDARNTTTLRWLEMLGFRVVEAHPDMGPEARLFYTFERLASV